MDNRGNSRAKRKSWRIARYLYNVKTGESKESEKDLGCAREARARACHGVLRRSTCMQAGGQGCTLTDRRVFSLLLCARVCEAARRHALMVVLRLVLSQTPRRVIPTSDRRRSLPWLTQSAKTTSSTIARCLSTKRGPRSFVHRRARLSNQRRGLPYRCLRNKHTF